MPSEGRLVTAGRAGRPHGLDGSFTVIEPDHPLSTGTVVLVAGVARRVERRAGTDLRPLVRLEGISSREAARAIGGELLLLAEEASPLGEDEFLASELVGCEVAGLGAVRRVLAGPSCDVLELDDGTLVPLVSDAVRGVDPRARRIEVHRSFLGLGEES